MWPSGPGQQEGRRNGPSKTAELEAGESVPGLGRKSCEGGVEERAMLEPEEIHGRGGFLVISAFSFGHLGAREGL